MNDRFVRLTNENATELYDLGYLGIGNLAKYRWLETNVLSYGLDDKDNNWHTGIVSHTYKAGFVRNSYKVIVNDKGISDKIEYLYDIIVYTSDPSLPRETISIDTHEIYLAKV
jgi:hypothetical protein